MAWGRGAGAWECVTGDLVKMKIRIRGSGLGAVLGGVETETAGLTSPQGMLLLGGGACVAGPSVSTPLSQGCVDHLNHLGEFECIASQPTAD